MVRASTSSAEVIPRPTKIVRSTDIRCMLRTDFAVVHYTKSYFLQLSAIFLHSSSSPQSSWTTVGIGIRVAQDVGAHRRKVYNAPLSVESELWKRAFW